MACLLVQSILTSTHEVWWSDCDPIQNKTVGNMPKESEGSTQNVFIGQCMMSEEDSRVLRRQVILLDLQKVKELLDQIHDRLQEQSIGAQDYGHPSDIGYLVRTLLRAQLERLLQRVSQSSG